MKTNMDALMWDIIYIITAFAIFALGVVFILYTALQQKENKHKNCLERDIRKNSWS